MQQSFWCWQCSDRYIITLFPHLHTPFPPFSLSLISRSVSGDIKHHVTYLLTYLMCGVCLYMPGFVYVIEKLLHDSAFFSQGLSMSTKTSLSGSRASHIWTTPAKWKESKLCTCFSSHSMLFHFPSKYLPSLLDVFDVFIQTNILTLLPVTNTAIVYYLYMYVYT